MLFCFLFPVKYFSKIRGNNLDEYDACLSIAREMMYNII